MEGGNSRRRGRPAYCLWHLSRGSFDRVKSVCDCICRYIAIPIAIRASISIYLCRIYLYSCPQSPTALYSARAFARPAPNAASSMTPISSGLSSNVKTCRLAAALFDTPSLVPTITEHVSGRCKTHRVATFEMSTWCLSAIARSVRNSVVKSVQEPHA